MKVGSAPGARPGRGEAGGKLKQRSILPLYFFSESHSSEEKKDVVRVGLVDLFQVAMEAGSSLQPCFISRQIDQTPNPG